MIGSLHGRDESVDNMLHFDCEIFEVGSRHPKRKMHKYHFRGGRLVETTLNIDHCLSFVVVDVDEAIEAEMPCKTKACIDK